MYELRALSGCDELGRRRRRHQPESNAERRAAIGELDAQRGSGFDRDHQQISTFDAAEHERRSALREEYEPVPLMIRKVRLLVRAVETQLRDGWADTRD
ncbi:MAG: hypothetical protein EPO68_09470 [Planctomycetota bacterium]|nr:MAG: hypothetical protein EPO68_09470 [Planctomycetota bacterium]